MHGYVDNIETLTLENKNFRTVLYTAQHLQLVLMSIPPQGEIGTEVHTTTDQFLRIESGTGVVIMNGEEQEVHDGTAIVVPAGTEHNVKNTSQSADLKLYTLYGPPHHKDGTVHVTKAAADADTEDHV